MDKEKLKLIIRNIELLLDSLKVEIYSEVNTKETTKKVITDYDEIFDEYED